MKLELKRATIADLKSVSHLFNLYRIFYEQTSTIEDCEKFISERLTKNDSVIFVVEFENKLVGFTQLYPTFSSVSMKSIWILNDLYVDETARNLGVAQKLLDAVKNFALQTGAKSIQLETAETNKVAKKLYEKNGYKLDNSYLSYSINLE